MLTPRQQRVKEIVRRVYGDWVHEGQQLDPVCRDIEALLLSSQERVTGKVHLLFRPGRLFVEGVDVAVLADGRLAGRLRRGRRRVDAADARGFSRIVALPGMFHARAGGEVTCGPSSSTRSPRSPAPAASATRCACSDEIPCEEGVVVAVRGAQQQVAPTTSSSCRAAAWPRSRRATSWPARSAIATRCSATRATCPTSVKPGDTVHLLNIGGVIGICDSVNPDLGQPFDCEVLGGVLHFPYLGERIGVPARIGDEPLDLDAPLDTPGVPVVALAGSCMNSGKTAAACASCAASAMRPGRRRVQGDRRLAAPRHPGDGRRRRAHVAIFTDFGIVSTTRKTRRRSRAPC